MLHNIKLTLKYVTYYVLISILLYIYLDNIQFFEFIYMYI